MFKLYNDLVIDQSNLPFLREVALTRVSSAGGLP